MGAEGTIGEVNLLGVQEAGVKSKTSLHGVVCCGSHPTGALESQ